MKAPEQGDFVKVGSGWRVASHNPIDVEGVCRILTRFEDVEGDGGTWEQYVDLSEIYNVIPTSWVHVSGSRIIYLHQEPPYPATIVVETLKGKATTSVKQKPSGGFLVEGPLSGKLTEGDAKVVKAMFGRYNTAVLAGAGGIHWYRRPPGDTITVGLVACSSSKATERCAAKDMYTSGLFMKSRRWVELYCDAWAILSAKHFVLMPDDVIDPYDMKIRDRAAYNADHAVRWWASEVNHRLYRTFGEDTHYVVLGGADYVTPFTCYDARGLGEASSFPLDRMQIGQRLQWLSNEIRAADPPEEAPRPKKLSFLRRAKHH